MKRTPRPEEDRLADLVVMDRLEVGPAKVEPSRLMMPYRVKTAEGEQLFELVYRWEEPVFEPGAGWADNLAGLIGAQVALNYGLFCRQLVFRGPFDRADRALLADMAENTAREILVLKLLQDNPFLTAAAQGIEPRKRDRYCTAELAFPDPTSTAPDRWDTSPDRVAVLSSGGKDSLLSYGLLKEIGAEVHPIFINESGRHWFTAVNAYRHFDDRVPHTARVWTNADRLFAWMLRQLPFVRPDFARLRSDGYPIRLWTVAVFAFGALPLLRKRGIGRLVIGDEYDSTVRKTFHGIPHYNGYYDQSRYFDQALTRTYQRKRWRLSQFSVLRPLSEMLIEKILVERYPDLWRHQVSCHATHKDGERVRPCGRCEKCRRIVGMLLAMGADPAGLGYDHQQVSWCVEKLASDGVHQEGPGVQQLALMLKQRGILDAGVLGPTAARERPEILKLRFDAERSPFDTTPVDLREPLFRIMLQHAEGAVRRIVRVLKSFEPLDDPEMHKPYPFERQAQRLIRVGAPSQDKAPNTAGAPAVDYLLGEMSWPEAERRLGEVDLALLPVGAFEQHGPHLPLDTDAYDADYLARQVAAACSPPRPLVLPLIPYGVSYHHDDFRGTISISPRALSGLVHEVGMAAARNGVTKLVIINGHGGNAPALKFAAQMINADSHIFTCVDTGESSDADLAKLTETEGDVHAGEVETSTSLATRPGLVHMERAKPFVPNFSSRYLDFSSKRSVEWFTRTARISTTGVLGDPTRASEAKGREMWAIMIRNLVEFVEQLKDMSLDEIYQRKY